MAPDFGSISSDIRVLHIDRNQLFREGLRRILQDTCFRVRAAVASVKDGIDQMSALSPDLVLVDAHENCEALPDLMYGAKRVSPQPRVVMLTDTVAIPRLASALGAGLHGYLLKDMSAEALKQSLHLVRMGQTVFPTNLADLLIDSRLFTAGTGGHAEHTKTLSDRELQILSCLVHGHSNKAIGNQLDIAEGTVKMHLKGIVKKIHVSNRTQAAIWAVQHGIASNTTLTQRVEYA